LWLNEKDGQVRCLGLSDFAILERLAFGNGERAAKRALVLLIQQSAIDGTTLLGDKVVGGLRRFPDQDSKNDLVEIVLSLSIVLAISGSRGYSFIGSGLRLFDRGKGPIRRNRLSGRRRGR
jgi:hypothetical protein